MKLFPRHVSRFTFHVSRNTHDVAPHQRRQESGMAVIVVMILLSIILIYVAGNLRMLRHLSRDVRLVEHKQIRRLEATNAPTRFLAVTNQPPLQDNQQRTRARTKALLAVVKQRQIQSGRAQPHSKTLRNEAALGSARQRFGVRLCSAALRYTPNERDKPPSFCHHSEYEGVEASRSKPSRPKAARLQSSLVLGPRVRAAFLARRCCGDSSGYR